MRLILNNGGCVEWFIHRMCARSRGEGIPQRGFRAPVGLSNLYHNHCWLAGFFFFVRYWWRGLFSDVPAFFIFFIFYFCPFGEGKEYCFIHWVFGYLQIMLRLALIGRCTHFLGYVMLF